MHRRFFFLAVSLFGLLGCARLFGWDIHAPGILSDSFSQQVKPIPQRMALYFPPTLMKHQSRDRGGSLADPQIYHVGEALAPMLLEGFQSAFEEFIFLEVEPTSEILRRYAIPYLVMVKMKDFSNQVTLKGQALTLVTETLVLDADMKPLTRFESHGTSDAKAVFRKKGGPEVNLNAAVERNVLAIVQYLQDRIRQGTWEAKNS